jgi:hypothetical protein
MTILLGVLLARERLSSQLCEQTKKHIKQILSKIIALKLTKETNNYETLWCPNVLYLVYGFDHSGALTLPSRDWTVYEAERKQEISNV